MSATGRVSSPRYGCRWCSVKPRWVITRKPSKEGRSEVYACAMHLHAACDIYGRVDDVVTVTRFHENAPASAQSEATR